MQRNDRESGVEDGERKSFTVYKICKNFLKKFALSCQTLTKVVLDQAVSELYLRSLPNKTTQFVSSGLTLLHSKDCSCCCCWNCKGLHRLLSGCLFCSRCCVNSICFIFAIKQIFSSILFEIVDWKCKVFKTPPSNQYQSIYESFLRK